MLDSSRLRLLVAVADLGSIAAAAAERGCSPAAASQQLGVLEREAGAQLLERSARSVRLSSAGQVLVEHARPILADLDTAARAVADAGSGKGGRLRIASFATATPRLVIPAIRALRQRLPGLQQTFVELEPEESLPALQAGQLDVAIVHHYTGVPAPDTRGLTLTHLYTDPLVLLVPSTHPAAASAEPVELRSFADADWISGRITSAFQAVTETAGPMSGFEPRITSRADSYGVVLDLVAAGLGVALLPRSIVTPRAGLAQLPIASPAGLARVVNVAHRVSDHSPAVAAFCAQLLRRARNRQGDSSRPRRTT